MPDIFNSAHHSSEETEQSNAISDASHVSENIETKQDQIPPKKAGRVLEDYSQVMREESVVNNPLAAFISKPTSILFDSQAHAEQIILVLRKHPITQVPWVLSAVAAAFLPLLLGYIGFLNFLPPNFQFAGLVIWLMLLSGFVLEKFLQWFFNVYIVTDERIIDVDFVSLIYKNISTAKIEKIEDVTATTGGALQSVVNFGTIKIQTAAEKNEFEFEEVPQPAKVARLLNELILEEERENLEGRVS